jgi:hypothetical protein
VKIAKNKAEEIVSNSTPEQLQQPRIQSQLKRLQKFTGGRKWQKSNLQSDEVLKGTGAKGSFRKISNITHKRAAASDPVLHSTMVDQLESTEMDCD